LEPTFSKRLKRVLSDLKIEGDMLPSENNFESSEVPQIESEKLSPPPLTVVKQDGLEIPPQLEKIEGLPPLVPVTRPKSILPELEVTRPFDYIYLLVCMDFDRGEPFLAQIITDKQFAVMEKEGEELFPPEKNGIKRRYGVSGGMSLKLNLLIVQHLVSLSKNVERAEWLGAGVSPRPLTPAQIKAGIIYYALCRESEVSQQRNPSEDTERDEDDEPDEDDEERRDLRNAQQRDDERLLDNLYDRAGTSSQNFSICGWALVRYKVNEMIHVNLMDLLGD